MPQAMVWAKAADHYLVQNQRERSGETSVKKWTVKIPKKVWYKHILWQKVKPLFQDSN
jgi:hypothetical protein